MITEPFSTNEILVLDALAKHASGTGTASGHDIRLVLLAAGLGKKEIGMIMGELVTKGVLERVKVVDADGFFYMAYRRTRQ
jgi:NAD(P)H-hydrate repair Nnr-like enzyme with NAD(P)H-hydrate dehydratase domain